MSDVREQIVDAIYRVDVYVSRKGADAVADAILEKWDLTPKPEPPVISDVDLGKLVFVASGWTENASRGIEMRHQLARQGLEIVRKAETE